MATALRRLHYSTLDHLHKAAALSDSKDTVNVHRLSSPLGIPALLYSINTARAVLRFYLWPSVGSSLAQLILQLMPRLPFPDVDRRPQYLNERRTKPPMYT